MVSEELELDRKPEVPLGECVEKKDSVESMDSGAVRRESLSCPRS